jgi:hypothetical protein
MTLKWFKQHEVLYIGHLLNSRRRAKNGNYQQMTWSNFRA